MTKNILIWIDWPIVFVDFSSHHWDTTLSSYHLGMTMTGCWRSSHYWPDGDIWNHLPIGPFHLSIEIGDWQSTCLCEFIQIGTGEYQPGELLKTAKQAWSPSLPTMEKLHINNISSLHGNWGLTVHSTCLCEFIQEDTKAQACHSAWNQRRSMQDSQPLTSETIRPKPFR